MAATGYWSHAANMNCHLTNWRAYGYLPHHSNISNQTINVSINILPTLITLLNTSSLPMLLTHNEQFISTDLSARIMVNVKQSLCLKLHACDTYGGMEVSLKSVLIWVLNERDWSVGRPWNRPECCGGNINQMSAGSRTHPLRYQGYRLTEWTTAWGVGNDNAIPRISQITKHFLRHGHTSQTHFCQDRRQTER